MRHVWSPEARVRRRGLSGKSVRAVEGARLESVYTGNCIKGSNPFLSARKPKPHRETCGAFSCIKKPSGCFSLLSIINSCTPERYFTFTELPYKSKNKKKPARMIAIIATILAGFFYFAPFLINAFQSVTHPLTGFPLFLLTRLASNCNLTGFRPLTGFPLFLHVL